MWLPWTLKDLSDCGNRLTQPLRCQWPIEFCLKEGLPVIVHHLCWTHEQRTSPRCLHLLSPWCLQSHVQHLSQIIWAAGVLCPCSAQQRCHKQSKTSVQKPRKPRACNKSQACGYLCVSLTAFCWLASLPFWGWSGYNSEPNHQHSFLEEWPLSFP